MAAKRRKPFVKPTSRKRKAKSPCVVKEVLDYRMSEGCFDGMNVLIEPEVSLRLNIAPCKTQILKFLEEKGLELKFDKETDEAWLVPSVSKLLLQKFTEAEYEEGKHTVYQPSIEP